MAFRNLLVAVSIMSVCGTTTLADLLAHLTTTRPLAPGTALTETQSQSAPPVVTPLVQAHAHHIKVVQLPITPAFIRVGGFLH